MSSPTSEHATDEQAVGLLGPGSPVRMGLLVLLTYAVVGALAGVVWQWVWTPPGQVVQQHHVFFDSYASLRRVFTGTGLYVVVGAVTSALVALVVCLRAHGRELLVLVLVAVGSAIGAALMWRVGTLLGPSDPASLAAHTVTRTEASGALTVAGKSPYLAWPMASLFVLAIIFFGWPDTARDRRHRRSPSSDPERAGVSEAGP